MFLLPTVATTTFNGIPSRFFFDFLSRFLLHYTYYYKFNIIYIQNAAKEIIEWIVTSHVGLVPVFPTATMWTELLSPDVVPDIDTNSARKVWVFSSWSIYIYSFIHSLKSIEIEKLHNILKQSLNRCFNMTREWIDYKIAIAIYISGLFCSSCSLNLFIHSWNSIEIELILHNICNQILKRCFTITREQILIKLQYQHIF